MKIRWSENKLGEAVPDDHDVSLLCMALQAGGDFDDETRKAVCDLLEFIVVNIWNERVVRRRGRPQNFQILHSARLVAVLVRDYTYRGKPLKVSVAARSVVREDVGTSESRRKAQQNVERAYRKLRQARQDPGAFNTQVIEDAVTRIGGLEKRK